MNWYVVEVNIWSERNWKWTFESGMPNSTADRKTRITGKKNINHQAKKFIQCTSSACLEAESIKSTL